MIRRESSQQHSSESFDRLIGRVAIAKNVFSNGLANAAALRDLAGRQLDALRAGTPHIDTVVASAHTNSCFVST